MGKIKRIISAALVVVLAVSLLAGCGDSSEEKRDKDTLTVAITGDPPTLDPSFIIYFQQCQ